MIKQCIEIYKKLKNAKKKEENNLCYIFKKPGSCTSYNYLLEKFKKCTKSYLVFLIRESTSLNTLSITYFSQENLGKIFHCRFVFDIKEDKWVIANKDSTLEKYNNNPSLYEATDAKGIKKRGEQLMNLIFEEFPHLEQSIIIFPDKNQVTKNSNYDNYVKDNDTKKEVDIKSLNEKTHNFIHSFYKPEKESDEINEENVVESKEMDFY